MSNQRILVIDDDSLMRRIITQSLTKAGFDVHEAESAGLGIDSATQMHPDLILLDVMMPDMDGFEVIRQLRRHPVCQGIPIILLTAMGEISDKIQGMQLGADDYLTKPFDPRELVARVNAHIKRTSAYLQASPLTSLPGNPAIQQVIAARIASQEPFAVIYFDLTNFKSYNDKYGWLAGDAVLTMLSETIVKSVLAVGGKDDFVGHVGGDDFIVVTRPDLAEGVARAVLSAFDEEVVNHYNEEDRKRGYIEGLDRQGISRQIPIITLTGAIVANEHRDLVHPLQVAQLAAEVKTWLKGLPGSQIGFDRRRK